MCCIDLDLGGETMYTILTIIMIVVGILFLLFFFGVLYESYKSSKDLKDSINIKADCKEKTDEKQNVKEC